MIIFNLKASMPGQIPKNEENQDTKRLNNRDKYSFLLERAPGRGQHVPLDEHPAFRFGRLPILRREGNVRERRGRIHREETTHIFQ